MQSIIVYAEEVLRQHPAPALALTELQRRLRERRPTETPTCAGLRTVLENSPDRFRILDPWRHPWPDMGVDKPVDDVVVVSISRGPPDLGRIATETRLRESVRWIARSIDPRSTGSVSRLYALLLAEEGTRRYLWRRAA